MLAAYKPPAIAMFLCIFSVSATEGISTKKPKSINKIDKATRHQPVGFLIFNKKAFMSVIGTCRLIYKIYIEYLILYEKSEHIVEKRRLKKVLKETILINMHRLY